MGLLDELKQYLRDAGPGGLLGIGSAGGLLGYGFFGE